MAWDLCLGTLQMLAACFLGEGQAPKMKPKSIWKSLPSLVTSISLNHDFTQVFLCRAMRLSR